MVKVLLTGKVSIRFAAKPNEQADGLVQVVVASSPPTSLIFCWHGGEFAMQSLFDSLCDKADCN